MASPPDPMGVFLQGFYAWLRELIRKAFENEPPGEAVSGKLDVTFRPTDDEEKKDG